tara:strand:- start:2373 stop:3257 length:885 start_codon:yes stop_codon:yes gene_type:complete
MTTKISLPGQFRAPNLFRKVSEHLFSTDGLPNSVEFDFSKLRFVLPSGVVFLSNITQHLRQNGCEVSYAGTNTFMECIRFLDDSQFFLQHTGAVLRAQSKPRPTTMPLMEIRNNAALLWVDNSLIPWLSASADIPVRDLSELGTCIKELFNNISDHTDSEVGSIFAQWFPNERTIRISLADLGPGIPATARRVVPDMSDTQAVQRAFEDGFTAKSHPNNQGVGLHYLKQNVVMNLNGRLEIHSGYAEVKIQKAGNEAQFVLSEGRGFCPGTLLDMVFETDQIERSPEKPEVFEW